MILSMYKKMHISGYFLATNDISIIEHTTNVCFKKLIF